MPSHFFLWRYLFNVKTSGKCTSVVEMVMFYLRHGLNAEWIDMDLSDNTAGWRLEWFYIADH
jgi:hypothetical protein